MSSKWDHLPNDILEKVLEQIHGNGRRHYLHRCLLVNKQWFKLVHPKLYEEIYIHLFKEKNKLLYTLATPIYQPGVRVKSINLLHWRTIPPSKKKNRPDRVMDLFHSNGISEEPLDLLITHCLNDRKVCEPIAGTINWRHLLKALEKNGDDSWKKVESIPEYTYRDESFGGFDNYFGCAYDLRNSLTEFTLKNYMNFKVNGNYDDHFKDFSKLTHLKLKEDVVQYVYELQDLLVYFPHLVSIDVECGNTGFGSHEHYLKRTMHGSNCKVEEMKLTDYVPFSDEELLTLTKFPSLHHLTKLPPYSSRFNWVPSTIKVSTILEFLQSARTKLSTYHLRLNKLKIGDVKSMLINMYSRNNHETQQGNINSAIGDLHINFQYIDYSRDQPMIDMIVSREEQEDGTRVKNKIELTYDVELILVTDEYISDMKDLVLNCSKHIPKNNVHIEAPPFRLECLNQSLWDDFYTYVSEIAILHKYLPYY